MKERKYVIYIRVSTKKQGASGLGLESQRKICSEYIEACGGQCAAEFKDVESGTHRDRKGLLDAIEYCKKNQCGLVIAKLDRLARDVEFCFKVVNTGIEIHFCDMPQVNTLLLGVFAAVAQYERELTSDRTKKALAAKKAKGGKIGAASDRWQMSRAAKTQAQIDAESKQRGETKTKRYLESKDVTVFIKILKRVFPKSTIGDVTEWKWNDINTRGDNKYRILEMMRDFKDYDQDLFHKWDFSIDIKSTVMQVKLATFINGLRKSLKVKT